MSLGFNNLIVKIYVQHFENIIILSESIMIYRLMNTRWFISIIHFFLNIYFTKLILFDKNLEIIITM